MTTNGLLRGDPGEDLATALADLAYNLHWSWDPSTMDLFATLAPEAWHASHNPVAVLRAVGEQPGVLVEHADAIVGRWRELEAYLSRPARVPEAPRVGYFSAEFAIAECLPIYSGGLGVLAGDHLKAASDLGLALTGIGLLYRYGYFRQVIDQSGYQHEAYDRLDPDAVPLRPVLQADGRPVLIETPFPGRGVRARVWRAQV